jgi:mono/diheme cytochrome c family protein
MTVGAVGASAWLARSRWTGRGLVIIAFVLGLVAVLIIARMGTGPSSSGPDAAGRVVPTRLSPALVDGVDNHGQVLFGRYCDTCHPGGGAGAGADLRTAQSHRQYATDASIIRLVRTGGFDMPVFPQQMLSDDDLAQIASYVRTLAVETP